MLWAKIRAPGAIRVDQVVSTFRTRAGEPNMPKLFPNNTMVSKEPMVPVKLSTVAHHACLTPRSRVVLTASGEASSPMTSTPRC